MDPPYMFKIFMDTTLLHGFDRFTQSRIFTIEDALETTENTVITTGHKAHLVVLFNKRLTLQDFTEALKIALTKQFGEECINELTLVRNHHFFYLMTLFSQEIHSFNDCSANSWSRLNDFKTLYVADL